MPVLSFCVRNPDYQKQFKIEQMNAQLINHLFIHFRCLYTGILHINESLSVVSGSLRPHGSYSPGRSPGQNTGVGSLSLQEIFPTPRSNPGFLHPTWILYPLSHKGSPRIRGWVDYPFSSGFSWLRNWTGVSLLRCRWIFHQRAMREAPTLLSTYCLPKLC